jgi:dienelactone hydrolase
VKIYSPNAGNAPFPVIIFSHGLGGSRDYYEYLGHHWASHGYVSAHLQHAGSDDAVWRDVPAQERMRAMRRATLQPRIAIERARDVSFAIDLLEQWNRTNTEFKGRLDLSRIGVAGQSFGAHTTLTIAGQNYTPRLGTRTSLADPRVKAVIPMSAPVPANKSDLDAVYSAIIIPCLHMTGTKDTSPINDTKAEERRLPFDHSKNSDQFLMTFQDGDHMIFSGRPRMMGGGDKDTRFHELICESSTLFWDAYLREDANAKARLMNEFKNSLGVNGTFEVKLHR